MKDSKKVTLHTVLTAVENLAISTARGFEEVHEKFKIVDERLDGIELKVDELTTDMRSVKSLITNNRLDTIEDNVRIIKSHLKLQ